MRVLVTGTDIADDALVPQALRDEGHQLVRCHEAGAPSFPCATLLGEPCPLDGTGIDVAVHVGPTADAGITEAASTDEDGARCALRRHLPLVMITPGEPSPLSTWATSVVHDVADLPEAVVEAVDAPLLTHAAAATATFRSTLDIHGFEDVEADATVTRSDGSVRVVLRPSKPLPDDVAEKASVRVVGALNELDPRARRIGVSVAPPTV